MPFRLHADRSRVELRLLPAEDPVKLPEDFIGLGYEMSSAARLGLLSAGNQAYVQLIRNLGPHGVLRLGGIVRDFTRYEAAGAVIAEPKRTVVTRRSLEQLRGFLDLTGWSAIWSVNFGAGTLVDAVAEAHDVAMILGPRLQAIELGNEVENYGHGTHPLRRTPYRYEDYRAEYTQWRAAMLTAVPGLRFAAPDTAASVDWVERMALDSREDSREEAHGESHGKAHGKAHGDVQLLTTHFYRGDQKLGTEEQLLQPDPELRGRLERLRRASETSGIPWRMCETNSFFGGGHPGISDTLAAALWTLDYMLLLAQYGCAGVNLETGVNQLGFVSSYSPIEDDGAGHNTAGAPYYGMLAFAQAVAGCSTVLQSRLDAGDSTLTAYALGDGRHMRSIVLINRSRRACAVSLHSIPLGRASMLRLTGPSLESREGITLGGRAVDAAGRWSSAQAEIFDHAEIVVAPASATILRSR